jgi:hypothetical protein
MSWSVPRVFGIEPNASPIHRARSGTAFRMKQSTHVLPSPCCGHGCMRKAAAHDTKA